MPSLTMRPTQDGGFARVFDVGLPHGAAGRWMALHVHATGPGPWWVKLELTDSARGHIVREVFLGPLRRCRGRLGRATLMHVPAASEAMRLQLYGDGGALEMRGRVLGRGETTLRLLWQGARQVPGALRGALPGLLGRLRASLGQAPARAGEAPPYALWLTLFPPYVPVPPPDVALQVVVVGQDEAAIARSLGSAHGAIVVRAPADWAAIPAGWLLVLGAGESLATAAMAAFAAAATPDVDAVYADLDHIGADGAHHDPLFKPGPGRVLLRSGLLTRGACLFRHAGLPADMPAQAEAARLRLALAARRVARLPLVLTHVPCAAMAVPEENVAIVQADLDSAGLCATALAAGPHVRVTMHPPRGRPPRVSVIIPSACRSAHVLRCLRRVAAGTDYPDFEILLAVSAMSPTDKRQARVLRVARSLPRVRLLNLQMPDFNYATVNNRAAQEASGEMLLLLNDDVAPMHSGWLADMVAHMQDPGIGAVGARLLYGNNTVQHGGVVMGLANLCEHADRFRAATDPGPHGLALLDREISAVTAACMLVRAAAFRDIGGFDENFAIALNDVDLCLRLREKLWRIIYAASITLYHYESLSLGRHYAGGRAGLEGVEVRRLRARWGGVIADDPYYNPNASWEPGRLWQPAFPPRAPGFVNGRAKIIVPD